MTDIILPDRKLETMELYYPRKPVGRAKYDTQKERGQWFDFSKPNQVNGTPSTLTASGSINSKKNLVTDGTGYGLALDKTGDDWLWPKLGCFTYFLRVKIIDIGASGSYGTFIMNNSYLTTNYLQIFFKSNGSFVSLRSRISSGALMSSAYDREQGVFLNIMLTRDDSGNVSFYEGGELIATSSNSDNIYNRHNANFHVLGGEKDNQNSAQFEYESVYISKEHTTKNKALQITKKPYGFLIPA